MTTLLIALAVFGCLLAAVEWARQNWKPDIMPWRAERGVLGGVIGNGTRIGYSLTSPITYIRIGQVMNIDKFIALVANVVDTTVMGTSNIMTGAPGMIPIPSFEFTLLADFDPVTSPAHEVLRLYQAGSGQTTAGTAMYLGIEVPVNRAQTSFRRWEFQCFINGHSPNAPIGDKQTVKIVAVFQGSYAVYPPAAATII